jgi:hypothetical protein
MTQILRPTTETTNDGFYYDPVSHPTSVAVTPQQTVSFPYGASIALQNNTVSTSDLRYGTGQMDYRYASYKAISAPAAIEGLSEKTVTYAGFSAKTEGYTNGNITIQFGYNATGTILSNCTAPKIRVEYTLDGSNWDDALEVRWDVNGGSAGGGVDWMQPKEYLSNSATWRINSYTNNRVVNSGLVIPVDLTGVDTTKIKVRFHVAGGYIIPQGWPNSPNAPFYIGAGFQIADISVADANAVAAPPNSGSTGSSAPPANTVVLRTGGSNLPLGGLDTGIEFCQVLPGGLTPWTVATVAEPGATYKGIVFPNTWSVIPGTKWATYLYNSTTPYTTSALVVSRLTSPGAWADPSIVKEGANWISVPIGTPYGTGVSKVRFATTFTLPTTTNAALSLQLLVDDNVTVNLNGNRIGYQDLNQGGPVATITANSGFVVGVNTLTFDLVNTGGPLGLCAFGSTTYQGGSVQVCTGLGQQIGANDPNFTYTINTGTGSEISAGFAPGNYRARTTFTLPVGFQSASLSLNLYTDNVTTDIRLNGVSIGSQTPPASYYSGTPTTHTASANFKEGANVLEFYITNYDSGQDNPMGLDFLGQVSYVPGSGATGSTGMSTDNYDTPIVTIGGKPAYTLQIINDTQTSLPLSACSIISSTLRVNGTGVPAGLYSIHLRATDTVGATDDQIVMVNIYDNSKFNIMNESVTVAPSSFPYAGTISLLQYGGSGTITWKILTANTNLPGAVISGQTLSYSVNQYGTYQVNLLATDALGKTSTKTIQVTSTTSNAYKLIDGQIELLYSDSNKATVGNHNFSFVLGDKTQATATRSFGFLLNPQSSPVSFKQYSINKYWGSSETTPYSLPISGSVSGVTLGDTALTTLSNGLKFSVLGASSALQMSGPASSISNALAYANVPLRRASSTIGALHRTYVTMVYNNADANSMGICTLTPPPNFVGQFFTLNPQKPYFNSPDNSRDTTWTARVKEGSVLPKGISLDKNTGILYGPVVEATTAPGTVEFVSSDGVVRATFIVNFNFLYSDFNMNASLPIGTMGKTYTEGNILTTSTAALTSAEVIYGHLPIGLTLGVNGNSITVTGTPTETGYFDVWIKATNKDNKRGYIYRRMEVTFVSPLKIVTTSLPNIQTSVAYSAQMQAMGGTGQYTWTIGSGTLPTSITMNSAGLISGTTAVGSYSQSITFVVTDSSGATDSAVIPLAINNALTIVSTSPLPNPVAGSPYSFQFVGAGGTTPYTRWELNAGSPALPVGLSIGLTTGILSGTTANSTYNQNIVVKLTDTAASTTTKVFNLTTVGTAAHLSFDSSGVGLVKRGCTYQGVLRVTGTNTVAPYRWTASNLPTGLVLTPNSADQGATAIISGKTTQTFQNRSVSINVVDNGGANATNYVSMSSIKSVEFVTGSIPQGRVSVPYSVYITGKSCNNPWTFSLNGSSPALPSGFTLNSSGLLSGTTASPYNQTIIVDITDANNDVATQSYDLVVASSALSISTTSIPHIPSGQQWSYQLQATGGVPPYTWVAQDPAGMTVPGSGWQVTVHVTGTVPDNNNVASGTFTVSASGGSGSYTGTGTFPWSQVFDRINSTPQYIIDSSTNGETIVTPHSVDYSAYVNFQVIDIVTNQTISGSMRVPIEITAASGAFNIDSTSIFTGRAAQNKILPVGVSFSTTGLLSTPGTTDTFDEPVLFIVEDTEGTTASKTLQVTVDPPVTTTGPLTTGPDHILGTNTNVLGNIGMAPGDIAAISPRPFSSFYVYGVMPNATTSQLQVTVVVDNSTTGAYSNMIGTVESIDRAGLMRIKLSFAPLDTKLIHNYWGDVTILPEPGSALTHVAAVTVMNMANGAKLQGTFQFYTVNFGEIALVQAGDVELPVADFTSNLA